MEKRDKIVTALLLTTMLFCGVKEAEGVYHSVYLSNTKNKNEEKRGADHLDVPHEHVPEEELAHTTIKKQYQFSSLAK